MFSGFGYFKIGLAISILMHAALALAIMLYLNPDWSSRQLAVLSAIIDQTRDLVALLR